MTSASITNVPVMNPQMPKNSGAKNEGDKVDFMDLMNRSIDVTKELSPADKVQNNAVQRDVQGKDTQDVNTTEYKYDRTKERITVKNGEKNSAADEKVKKAVDDYGEDVKKVLKDELGVSDEEIEAKMAELGLTVMDLADPKQLINLISELTGQEDTVLLLMRSDVSDILSQVGDLTKALTEELNMTPVEINGIMADIDLTEKADAISFEDVLSGANEAVAFDTENIADASAANTVAGDATGSAASVKTSEDMTIPEDIKEIQAADNVDRKTETDAKNRPADQIVPEDNAEPEDPATGMVLSAENKNGAQSGEGEGQSQSFDMTKNRNDLNENTPEIKNDEIASFAQNVNEKAVQELYSEDVHNVTSYSDIDVNRVINDIAETARVTITEEVHTMEMVLNPEHLGRVYMEVSSEQGRVTARLLVENEAVKNALENQLTALKDAVTNSGTKIEAVEVSVGTHEFDKQLEEGMLRDQERREAEEQAAKQSAQGGRRSINLNDTDELPIDMTEEEELVAQIMRDEGNSVNYRA